MRHQLLAAICGLLAMISLADEPPNPNVIKQHIAVYRVASAPRIDGLDSDPCWQQASLATGFMLDMQEGQLANEQTEIRLSYDAQNLYLFYRVFESQMASFKPGPPPDVKDKIAEDEAIHLFLSQGFEGYFRFAVSPMGAQRDELQDYASQTSPGLGYDPAWQAKAGRFDGGWTMEIAIPFTALAYQDGLVGTPAPGTTWTMNLCRKRFQGESSQWCLSASSWRNYGCFGDLVFKGPASADPEPHVTLADDTLTFGANRLAFSSRNSQGPATFRYEVSLDGTRISQETVQVEKDWVLPLLITRGGHWQIAITYLENGRIRYQGQLSRHLHDMLPFLQRLSREIPASLANLQPAQAHFSADLGTKLQAIQSQLDTLAFIHSQAPETFTQPQWQAIRQTYATVTVAWQEVEAQAFQLSVYAPSTLGMALKIAPADSKIYPGRVPTTPLADSASLHLAGNETRSFQLLMVPFGEPLPEVTVAFTDLVAEDTRIAADHLTWHQIQPVKTRHGYSETYTMEPDVLVPGTTFSPPSDRWTSCWVNVHVPAGTPPGTYSGKVTVAATDGRQMARDLTVRVHAFSLPDRLSVKQNHWLDSRNFPGVTVTPAIYEDAMQLLAAYRVQPHYFLSHRLIKTYLEPDGSFSFDFSGLTDYLRIAKQHHANAYWSSMSAGVNGLVPFVDPNRPIIERATGKSLRLAECPGMREWLATYKAGKPAFDANPELAIIQATEAQNAEIYFDTNPLYRDYLRAYVAYLDAEGMTDSSYYELYDEAPQLEARWLDMIRHHRFLRKWVPSLRLFNFEVTPDETIGGQSAIGLVDGWGPQLFQCDDPELIHAINQRRQDHGEEFWFYVCTERSRGAGRLTPYTWRYRPLIGARLIPWFAWKLQVDGFHINSFTYQDLVTYQHGQLLPTMRLAMIRDGMQDYEYHALLRTLITQLDPARHQAFITKAEQTLEIEPEIITSIYEWTRSADHLDAKRHALSDLIAQATQLLPPEIP